MRCRSRIPLQSLRRSPGSTGVIQSRAKSLRFCIWPSPRRDSFVRPRAVSAGACAATCDARFISKANIDGLEYPLNSRGCQTSENTDHTPRSAPPDYDAAVALCSIAGVPTCGVRCPLVSEMCIHVSDVRPGACADMYRLSVSCEESRSGCRDQPVPNSVPDTQPSSSAHTPVRNRRTQLGANLQDP